MKHKSSHQFMTKMLSYQGLFVFLPYTLIHILKLSLNPISTQNSDGFLIFILIMFGIIFLFDIIGLKKLFLDKYSRIITTVVSYFGGICIGILGYLTYNNWNNSNIFLLFIVGCIVVSYLLIGWFYIRSEKTNKPSKEDKPLRSSAHCFFFSALPWGIGYFIHSIGILIGLIISLIFYPIVVYLGDKKIIEDEKNIIRPEKLAVRESFIALTDFIVDITKVLFLLITCIAFSYNGPLVLYPQEAVLNPIIYWRNLMWVTISASITAFVFEQLEELLFGKFIIILVFISAASQSIFSFLKYNDQWLIFSILNGITLAGVFTFIEQKIAKSGNVRVLPGSMFYLIFIIELITLLLNNFSELYLTMEILRLLIPIGGLIYVYYRISIEKKIPDLRKPGVKFSPLGVKYYDIPNNNN